MTSLQRYLHNSTERFPSMKRDAHSPVTTATASSTTSASAPSSPRYTSSPPAVFFSPSSSSSSAPSSSLWSSPLRGAGSSRVSKVRTGRQLLSALDHHDPRALDGYSDDDEHERSTCASAPSEYVSTVRYDAAAVAAAAAEDALAKQLSQQVHQSTPSWPMRQFLRQHKRDPIVSEPFITTTQPQQAQLGQSEATTKTGKRNPSMTYHGNERHQQARFESCKGRLDRVVTMTEDSRVSQDSIVSAISSSSSHSSSSSSSIKEEKQRSLDRNFEKRLLKKIQDDEVRQRRLVAGALAKTARNGQSGCNRSTISTAKGKKISALWPMRALRSATRNKENRATSTSSACIVSQKGDNLSEETTSRDPSNGSLCDASLSAVWSQDGDSFEGDGPAEERQVVECHSPSTATRDVEYVARITGPKQRQPALSLPVLNTKKTVGDEEDASSDHYKFSYQRGSPSCKSAMRARRMHLGVVRTVAMDGILESFPDMQGAVVATGYADFVCGVGELTMTNKLGSSLDPSRRISKMTSTSTPASAAEVAYYTSNQNTSKRTSLCPRDMSTMLTWL